VGRAYFVAALCAGIAIVIAAGGCSLLVDTNADPCRTDGDCRRAGSVCTPEHLCMAPADAGAPDVTTSDASDTLDANDADTCTDQACCSTGQCRALHGGEPYACPSPGHACVPLKTESCSRLIGAYDDPNAVVIGIVGLLSGASASTQNAMIDIVDLAFSELQLATLGLPAPAGSPARPLAAVACDELTDPDQKHLLDELHVPAIVGLGTSGYTVGLTPRLVASGTFFMCANCGSPALTSLDDHELVWRTEPSIPDMAMAMATYFPELEAKVRAADSIDASTPIKVAVLSNRVFIFSSATDKFVGNVSYNGKTPLANGANFFRVDYDDPNTAIVDLQAIANQVAAYAPNIIVLSGAEELPATVMPAIESAWGASPRPFYVAHSGISTDSLYTFVAGDPTRRARLRWFDWVTPAESQSVFASYAIREQARHPEQDPSENSNAYDAAYATIYALAAVDPAAPLTGAAIAQAVPRLVPPAPTTVAIGPSDLPDAFASLRKGSAIDLVGVFTDLDFDGQGDVHGDSALACMAEGSTPVDAGAPVYVQYYTQRVYSTATGQLSGIDDCP
jgi:ABC-type branched-subunit amino acid transport system substrate-binding protein